MDLPHLLERARTSNLHRWLLNAGLRWSIPFNRPHGFRVVPLADGGLRVDVPYKRANRNHIRGIHACCLATAAELCSGLALIGRLDPRRYRIIMGALQVEYHWQAKARAHAVFQVPGDAWKAEVLEPLQREGRAVFTAVVLLHDARGNHLATGRIHWQIKAWEQVRTRR
ncbi:MAG: DUF4442 domain-containing protein [Flavobacteriales bacterium]|nr:DUF4442 domain-containing protein [Flavobacteriales bacterium]